MAMASRVFVCFLFVCVVAIVTSTPVEDKPLDCGPDEQYYKCSLEVCWKKCADLKNPPPCPALTPDCFAPACVCKSGLLRNDNGKCVPVDKC